MVESFVSALQSIVDRAALGIDVECKHFFSGAAAYVDGQIFMTLTPVGLAIKLPDDACAGLIAAGAKPLRYFPNAPVKKSYVLLSDGQARDDEMLVRHIRASIDYARNKG